MHTRVIQILILVILSSCQESYIGPVHYLNDFEENCLGTRYFLDTISLKDPVLAVYNDALYVMPKSYSTEFVSNPVYQEGIKLFYIFPHNVRQYILDLTNTPDNETEFTSRAEYQLSMGSSLYSIHHFTTVFDKRVDEVEFYRFDPLPARFLVELVWYDPERFINNPYGPNFITLVSENHDSTVYRTKLDSLESVPIKPKIEGGAHYILTVEPLYSRETINNHILSKECSSTKRRTMLYSKRYARRFCFPDL